MSESLCAQSTDFAHELWRFLQQIDPARFRADLHATACRQFGRLKATLRQILESNGLDPANTDHRLARLYERMQRLAGQLEPLRPQLQLSAARARREWMELQRRLQPSYGAIAASLEALSAEVPVLRATNAKRTFYHLATAVISLVLIQCVLSPTGVTIAAVGGALWCWTSELLRTRYPVVTDIYLKVFGAIAHPHEMHRVNSATWYATALAGLACTVSPMATSVAVLVLGVADPMAALVGRRFGRTPLRAGRTLEGSLTFVVTGTIAAVAVLGAFYPQVPLASALIAGAVAGVMGGVAELFSFGLDDNLTIPLAAGWGVSLMVTMLG